MGFGPPEIPFNFESDLDHRMDTKKESRFTHLLIITCFGRGMHSLSALLYIKKKDCCINEYAVNGRARQGHILKDIEKSITFYV